MNPADASRANGRLSYWFLFANRCCMNVIVVLAVIDMGRDLLTGNGMLFPIWAYPVALIASSVVTFVAFVVLQVLYDLWLKRSS
jgi:hypothetical protein